MELYYLSATEALSKFKNKTLSPVELIKAVIDRSEKVNSKINAHNFTFYEKAIEAAKVSENKFFSNKEILPLEGIPMAIKDELDIKGQPNTNGSLILKDHIASKTVVDVERIINSGSIIHCRTTTPEFSCTSFTHSKIWGVTRNPWNLEFTPGGSSGGSGASLAAGCTTLATGSDIGGSIRIPASACGLIGFKPPHGRNPQEAPFNHDQYCVVGPMARTVEDCALMQNVMSGPHPKDITSLKPKLSIPKKFENIKNWKIAYSMDLGFFEIDKEVQKNTLDILKKFKSLGAKVEEVKLNWNKKELEDTCYNYYAHLFANFIAELIPEHSEKLTDYAKDIGMTPEIINKAILEKKKINHPTMGIDLGMTLYECNKVAGKMFEEFGPIIDKYDAFICPTLSIPAVKADMDLFRDKVLVNGKEISSPDLGWTLCYPFNMLNRLPVLSIPSGLASNGVPTGVQIVGKPFEDIGVFQAGYNIEQLEPWFKSNKFKPNL
jgi:amidase